MKTVKWWMVLLGTTLLVAPELAMGQVPPSNVPVTQRPRPDFDPLGIRAGAFLIFPSVTVIGTYDSNVYAEDNNRDDDVGLLVAPRITARSQWARHALEATVDARGGLFVEETGNNFLEVGGQVQGRLDITRQSRLNGTVSLRRRVEDRTDPNTTGVRDQTVFYVGRAAVVLRHEFARFFVQPGVQVTRLEYEDAGAFNNDDRDRIRLQGGVRAGFKVSPRINAFAEAAANVVRYDQTPDDAGVNRDSEGFSVRAGAEIDFTGLLFGEFAVGYARQDYDDPALNTADGLSALIQLTWNVTPLTSVIVTGEAGVRETTVQFAGQRASANLQQRISVEVVHELRRNVLISGLVGYQRDDFQGTARTDNSFRVGAGVRYLVNRWLSLDVQYDFTARRSDAAVEYVRHIVRTAVTLQR